jgi:hypothetical protein
MNNIHATQCLAALLILFFSLPFLAQQKTINSKISGQDTGVLIHVQAVLQEIGNF